MKNIKKGDRFKIYTNYLSEMRSVTMKAFFNNAKNSGIPEITARRDLKLLENFDYVTCEMGLIKYNASKAQETTRVEKTLENSIEKNKIAKTAIGLITSEEIFVGPGTTCEAFVRQINVPIKLLYTNGFEVAKVAENNKNIGRIIIIGGKLRPQSGAMCGPIAIKIVENLRFQQSFITVTNMNANLDLFNNHGDEAFLTSNIIDNSNQTICLLDYTKLSADSHGNIIKNSKNIDKFVFDSEPPKEWLEKLEIISDIKW